MPAILEVFQIEFHFAKWCEGIQYVLVKSDFKSECNFNRATHFIRISSSGKANLESFLMPRLYKSHYSLNVILRLFLSLYSKQILHLAGKGFNLDLNFYINVVIKSKSQLHDFIVKQGKTGEVTP